MNIDENLFSTHIDYNWVKDYLRQREPDGYFCGYNSEKYNLVATNKTTRQLNFILVLLLRLSTKIELLHEKVNLLGKKLLEIENTVTTICISPDLKNPLDKVEKIAANTSSILANIKEISSNIPFDNPLLNQILKTQIIQAGNLETISIVLTELSSKLLPPNSPKSPLRKDKEKLSSVPLPKTVGRIKNNTAYNFQWR